MSYYPVVLCILDGWGLGPPSPTNALTQACLPTWNKLWAHTPRTYLEASGEAVGLPKGQMGNSEVGHMTLGTGRIILQDLLRISKAFENKSVEKIPLYHQFVTHLKETSGTCHLMGLFSPGGVHAHQDHILSMANLLAHQGIPVKLHLFLDGRDSPPRSALDSLKKLSSFLSANPLVTLASLSGRYYAMDRDQRWERTHLAYQAIMLANAPCFSDPADFIHTCYQKGETDEFIKPTIHQEYKGFLEKDSLFMSNFRADRARQLLMAFLDPEFQGFPREQGWHPLTALGFSPYSERLNSLCPALFPKEQPCHTLGEVIAQKKLKQCRLAETEKYAHVTFFFNGGRESPYPGEDRILVPSPSVSTYDLKPEMSAAAVTEQLIQAIQSQAYHLIVVNYANPDMVGHTGKLPEIIKALEKIDHCLAQVQKATQETGTTLVITADHGNAEQTWDEATNMPHTAHTNNPVPFLIHGVPHRSIRLREKGGLSDVSPTILDIMGLKPPLDMTGKTLII